MRVCEEITRFVLDNRKLTAEFKKIRHQIDETLKYLPDFSAVLLRSRSSLTDVGRDVYINELKRKNLGDIFFANLQRVKESLRVLEEFAKLKNINSAIKFKKIRYVVYEIEKKAAEKIASLCNRR